MADQANSMHETGSLRSTVVYSKSPYPKRIIVIDCDEFVDHWRRSCVTACLDDSTDVDSKIADIVTDIVDLAGCNSQNIEKLLVEKEVFFVIKVIDWEIKE